LHSGERGTGALVAGKQYKDSAETLAGAFGFALLLAQEPQRQIGVGKVRVKFHRTQVLRGGVAQVAFAGMRFP